MRTFMLFSSMVFAGAAALFAGSDTKTGVVDLQVLDQSDGKQVPCRVHLYDANRKPIRFGKLPFWRDHFVCNGKIKGRLPSGKYSYVIERGPEYQSARGELQIQPGKVTIRKVVLNRIADLAKAGWWPGELHVHRAPKDVPLLMQAEDLHVAPVITWWNNRNLWKKQDLPKKQLIRFDGNRFYQLMAGEDEREGGALLYFHLTKPLPLAGSNREFPSPLHFAALAHKQHAGVWIDIEKPFWWDVPLWLAFGIADSIGLANNHMCRSQMYQSEAWGKPRDVKRLPPPRGNGMWTQEIYYHILNCGFRLPPSAGSASGVLPNPVGYNRAYVYLGKDFTYEKWFDGLRAGRVFVTNGPLLRVTANGKLPGHVFSAKENAKVELTLNAVVEGRDNVPFLEVIKNGVVYRKVPYAQWKKTGSLGSLTFRESGWLLVRAVTDNKKTFRFASTGPFYVEVGKNKKHVSRRSALFFAEWVRERTGRVGLKDAQQRQEVLRYHETARRF